MRNIKLDISTAGISDWAGFYFRVSTNLKEFCREIGRTPVPVIDTYERLDAMTQGFYQFGPFLKWSGLQLAYEKTRTMLQNYIAEHRDSASIILPRAAEHFPIIIVSGLSEREQRAEQGSEILRFLVEQQQIKLILEQYLS